MVAKNNVLMKQETAKSLVWLVFILFVVVVTRSAWVGDDAYITLRTVDNLYNGHGLTWNPDERVQTFTHPLWVIVISLVYFVFTNPYFTMVFLSISLSALTVYLLLTKISNSSTNSIISIMFLICSKAYIDYSTSGLENPLSHLLFALFIIFLFKHSEYNKHQIFCISFISSLLVLNRMDNFLLIFPALVIILYRNFSKQTLLLMILGFLPFILWELFSIGYYGFLLPNTAYAKLNTEIPKFSLYKQGILYYLYTLGRDPSTLIILSCGFALSFISKDWRKISLVFGIFLYMIYIVRIGGDFMAGRFLSTSVFGAAALIANSNFDLRRNNMFLAALFFILYIMTPYPPISYNYRDSFDMVNEQIYNGIADERLFYFPDTGLLTISRNEPITKIKWSQQGISAKEKGESIIPIAAAGFFGYYAGDEIHIVDYYALCDPLLSKLPAELIVDQEEWRIGHYYRNIPDGYLETLETGENLIVDKNLAKYYEKLSIVIKGNIFEPGRLTEIWRLNTGYYDNLIDGYVQNLQ